MHQHCQDSATLPDQHARRCSCVVLRAELQVLAQLRPDLREMTMKNIPVGSFIIGAPLSSSGKGKNPMSDAQAKAEVMLSEYRHALNDVLGEVEGEAFGLACLHYLGDHKNVGVAWLASQQCVYLLFGGADRPEPEYLAVWLLDMAKELTLFLRTFVVPDQTSAATSFWGGLKHGPIISYRFKLADSPTILNI